MVCGLKSSPVMDESVHARDSSHHCGIRRRSAKHTDGSVCQDVLGRFASNKQIYCCGEGSKRETTTNNGFWPRIPREDTTSNKASAYRVVDVVLCPVLQQDEVNTLEEA